MDKKIGLVIGIVIIAVLAFATWRNTASTPAPAPVVTAPNVSGTPSTPTDTVKTFTAADVTAHAASTDCYTIVNGKVYDLTSWVSKHPGGPEAIASICGKDGTQAFADQHGSQRKPNNVLDGYFIGNLAN